MHAWPLQNVLFLMVNSRGYYKFQVEIGAATNRGFYTKIVCKVYIYGFQPCTM